MGYTVPEWIQDNESVVKHFVKLFSEYLETYEEDFDIEEMEEEK